MADLKNPMERQQFLESSINRNLLIRDMQNVLQRAKNHGLREEAEMIAKLIEYFEQGDETDYRALRRRFMLKRLRV